MFWKLTAVILTLMVTAAWVLSLRQSRVAVANELASIHLRVKSLDERLFALRADISHMVTPERVGTMVAGVAELKPLVMPSPDAAAEKDRLYADGMTKPKDKSKPAAPR